MFQELAAKPAAAGDASPAAEMPQNPFASSLPSSVSTQSPAASLQGKVFVDALSLVPHTGSLLSQMRTWWHPIAGSTHLITVVTDAHLVASEDVPPCRATCIGTEVNTGGRALNMNWGIAVAAVPAWVLQTSPEFAGEDILHESAQLFRKNTAVLRWSSLCLTHAAGLAGLEDYKPPANAFMLHGWTLNGFIASNGHASDGHTSTGASEHHSEHSVPLTHSASIPQTGPMAIPQRPLPPLPPSMLSLSGHSPGQYTPLLTSPHT